MTPRALDAMNDEALRRHPPLPLDATKPPPAKAAGSLFRRSLSRGRRRRSPASQAVAAAPLHRIVLGAELPQREREFDRRAGDDPYRPPFRVSQIEIRKHFRATVDADRPYSAVTTPATSTIDRMPFVAMYADAERS
jgi:hypothetical protein